LNVVERRSSDGRAMRLRRHRKKLQRQAIGLLVGKLLDKVFRDQRLQQAVRRWLAEFEVARQIDEPYAVIRAGGQTLQDMDRLHQT